MPIDRSICLIHLPRSVVDELFRVHDHQVSMQQRGISQSLPDESYRQRWTHNKVVPNLLRPVTNTNSFQG